VIKRGGDRNGADIREQFEDLEKWAEDFVFPDHDNCRTRIMSRDISIVLSVIAEIDVARFLTEKCNCTIEHVGENVTGDRPEYYATSYWHRQGISVEVNTLVLKSEDREFPRSRCTDPIGRVRNAVGGKARKKLREDIPILITICLLDWFELDFDDVLCAQALYASEGIGWFVNKQTGVALNEFADRRRNGVIGRPSKNTSVSAVAFLDRTRSLDFPFAVFHNPCAVKPVFPTLFVGSPQYLYDRSSFHHLWLVEKWHEDGNHVDFVPVSCGLSVFSPFRDPTVGPKDD
jgi:hypothetical protein